MKTFFLRGLIALAATLVFASGNGTAFAQAPSSNAGKPVLIADTDIHDASLQSQEQNIFHIAFDLDNGRGVQPGVRYAVQLFAKEEKGRSLVDEHVYAEVFNLSGKQSLHQEITYEAPAFLKGPYELWLVAKNQNGLLLSLSLVGEVQLAGNGQYLEIVPSTCFLQVSGQGETDKKYTLTQGVDIVFGEKVTLTCDINNHIEDDISFTPHVSTYHRSTFGQSIDTSRMDTALEYTLAFRERKTLTFTLPLATEPQAYDAVLTLERNGGIASNDLVLHYVVRGESATIQNIVFDQPNYRKGDTAKISFTWTASADDFPNARGGDGTPVQDPTGVFQLSAQDGRMCASDVSQPLVPGKMDIAINVTQDCSQPKLVAQLKNQSGKTLDKVAARAPFVEDQGGESSSHPMMKLGLFAVALLLVSVLSWILFSLWKKRSRGSGGNGPTGMTMGLFFLLISCVYFFGAAEPTHAATFILTDGTGRAVTFTVTLNKGTYAPGESIRVAAAAQRTSCVNIDAYWLNGGLDGDYSQVIVAPTFDPVSVGQKSFTAPSMRNPGGPPERHLVTLEGFLTAGSTTVSDRWEIQFFVDDGGGGPIINQPPVATIVSPSGNRTIPFGGTMDFLGTGSDPNGDPITNYEWRENSCAAGTPLLGITAAFSKDNFSVGTHQVYLRVRDSKGAWSTNCPSRIIDVTPSQVLNINLTANPSSCSNCTSLDTTISVNRLSSSTTNPSDSLSYQYDCGIGYASTDYVPGNTHSCLYPVVAGQSFCPGMCSYGDPSTASCPDGRLGPDMTCREARARARQSTINSSWETVRVLLTGPASVITHIKTLTVAKNGIGTGRVYSTQPASPTIDCGSVCQHIYPANIPITLWADPDPGSSVGGWSEPGCSGRRCSFILDFPRTVTVTFDVSGPPPPPPPPACVCDKDPATICAGQPVSNSCGTFTSPNCGTGTKNCTEDKTWREVAP